MSGDIHIVIYSIGMWLVEKPISSDQMPKTLVSRFQNSGHAISMQMPLEEFESPITGDLNSTFILELYELI